MQERLAMDIGCNQLAMVVGNFTADAVGVLIVV
jgi:hypothetical protein